MNGNHPARPGSALVSYCSVSCQLVLCQTSLSCSLSVSSLNIGQTELRLRKDTRHGARADHDDHYVSSSVEYENTVEKIGSESNNLSGLFWPTSVSLPSVSGHRLIYLFFDSLLYYFCWLILSSTSVWRMLSNWEFWPGHLTHIKGSLT